MMLFNKDMMTAMEWSLRQRRLLDKMSKILDPLGHRFPWSKVSTEIDRFHLGSDKWKCELARDEIGDPVGLRLMNRKLTPRQIAIVEEAIVLIVGGEELQFVSEESCGTMEGTENRNGK